MKRGNGNIWKEAVVLLVVATMLFTALPAAIMADTGDEPLISQKEKVFISARESGAIEPGNWNPNIAQLPSAGPVRVSEEGSGSLDGGTLSDVWITYAGPNSDAVGLTSPGTWQTAIRLTPDELAPYDGYVLDSVKVYHGWSSGSPQPAIDITVIIYGQGTTTTPGPVLTTEPYSIPDQNDWFEIDLSNPVTVDATQDLWVSIEWDQTTAPQYPAGCDSGPMLVDKGGFVYLNGAWDQIAYATGGAIDVNWNIQAGLSQGWTPPSQGCDFAVTINSPSGYVNSNPTAVNITYYNYGPVPINEVKKLLDIYKEIPGPTSTIFSDDMEGNVSENWAIVDNGDGDSFTISDERAHSGTYSYRCTAGRWRSPTGDDPDIYLGHAADSGPDELILKAPQDLDGAAYGVISFWDWCTGEYYVDDDGYVVPTDYGVIALSNDNGTTWTYVDPSDFIAYSNDWRETKIGVGTGFPGYMESSVDFVVPIALTDQMVIKFIWTSDPHMEYEGWYIDDVTFTRTEVPSYELVFQGHLLQDVPASEYDGISEEFPLEWDPEPNTVYKIIVCGQVFDPANCDVNPDNNCDESWVIIRDIHDVASLQTVGPDRIEKGDTGSFDVTIKNAGTYPEAGFPVNLEIHKKISDVTFDGFETGGWEYWYIPGVPTLSHRTNCDSYEGSWSLAMTTDCCDFPTVVPYSLSIALYPDPLDFTGDNVRHATMKYAAKWALSEQVGSSTDELLPPVDPLGNVGFYDWWSLAFMDPDNEGSIFFATPTGGFGTVYIGTNDGEWESADAPGAHPGYYTADLIQIMDQIHSSYPAYFQQHKCKVGFILVTNDDEYILNGDVKSFAGLFVDNVEFIKTYCDPNGEIVNTTTAGYLDPGDEETLTMTWHPDAYCDYCVCGVTDLDTDMVPENDTSCTQTRVTTTADEPEWETEDLTWTDQGSMWHIVAKHYNPSLSGEPPKDQYWWDGDDDLGTYVPWMDDSLISDTIDMSGYSGAILTFDTYYDIKSGDYGAVYCSNDNGVHWTQLATYAGTRDWHIEGVTIPASAMTSTFNIKFRFFSDGYDEGNGWYIDDVKIVPILGTSNVLSEDFSTSVPPAGWTRIQTSTEINYYPCYWSQLYLSGYMPNPPFAEVWWGYSPQDEWLITPPLDLSSAGGASLTFLTYNYGYYPGYWEGDYIKVSTDGGTTWDTLGNLYEMAPPYPDGFFGVPVSFDLSAYAGQSNVLVAFHRWTGSPNNNLGIWFVDDVNVDALTVGTPVFQDDMENGTDLWTAEWFHGGDWWHETDYRYYCDDDNQAWWCGDESTHKYPNVKLDDALYFEMDLTETDIGEPYTSVDIDFATWHDMKYGYYYDQWSDTYNYVYLAEGYVEISTDYGLTWQTLREYRGQSSGWIEEHINLDSYIPNHIILRFRFVNMGVDYEPSGATVVGNGEGWYIDCFQLHYKHEIFTDELPPVTSICVDGNTVYLTAYDPAGPIVSGVCATYYTVNGGPTQTYWSATDPDNSTGPFTVPEGTNTIEYWSVDCAGNEETHNFKTVIVDTAAPTVTITQPEPGALYLFGNKIMNRIFSNTTLCIGKITIIADASDSVSGINRVEFTIDNDTGFDYTAPYEYTYAKKAFGLKQVTVRAIDNAGNDATASTEFKIYCLGLF